MANGLRDFEKQRKIEKQRQNAIPLHSSYPLFLRSDKFHKDNNNAGYMCFTHNANYMVNNADFFGALDSLDTDTLLSSSKAAYVKIYEITGIFEEAVHAWMVDSDKKYYSIPGNSYKTNPYIIDDLHELEPYIEAIKNRVIPDKIKPPDDIIIIKDPRLARFYGDVCINERGKKLPVTLLYTIYTNWCKAHGYSPYSILSQEKLISKFEQYHPKIEIEGKEYFNNLDIILEDQEKYTSTQKLVIKRIV